MSNMEDLLKSALRALVHTLEEQEKNEKHEKHEEQEEPEQKQEEPVLYLSKSNSKPFETVSGRYRGIDFETAKTNKDNAIVAGSMKIEGLNEPLKTSFMFSGDRFESGLFRETLKVVTAKGGLTAEALYMDKGDGILSAVEQADYLVLTSTGEFSDFKGHHFRIAFDNKSEGKPRNISLAAGFGPDKKDAAIGEPPVCMDIYDC